MRKISLMVMAVLMGFILSGCAMKTHDDKSFEELAYGEKSSLNLSSAQHEQVADGFVRRAKPEMALIHYNKAIEKDENNLSARVKRGELLVGQGLDEQALTEFLNVLTVDPNHAIANESAGGVYFRAGLYTEAEAHLKKAVSLNGMLWKAHNYLGILYDRQDRYDDAIANFRRALELHKGTGSDEIYNNLGVAFIARKEYTDAVNAFREALKSGGVSARTYNNLGLALTRMGRLDEALESFKYAGGEAKAYNNIGYVLLTDNQPAKAVPYFEKAIELSPNYYVKAADNLKRARLAARFQEASEESGSTPNPLLRKSFPDAEQNPGGPAASPASAGSPPSEDVRSISYEVPGAGGYHIPKTYGVHISSWQNYKNAFVHCAMLMDVGFVTWVNQVDLDEKGVWYRVLVGRFDTYKSAKQARPAILDALHLDRAMIYKREIPRIDGVQM